MVNFDFNFWSTGLLLLNSLLALFVAFSNRGKARSDELKAVKTGLDEDIKELSDKIVAQGERLSVIETEVDNGIDKSDLHAIYDRVNAMATVVDVTQGRLDEMSNSLVRIDEHLMQLLMKK